MHTGGKQRPKENICNSVIPLNAVWLHHEEGWEINSTYSVSLINDGGEASKQNRFFVFPIYSIHLTLGAIRRKASIGIPGVSSIMGCVVGSAVAPGWAQRLWVEQSSPANLKGTHSHSAKPQTEFNQLTSRQTPPQFTSLIVPNI